MIAVQCHGKIGVLSAYLAAIVAFSYAAISLYWTLGGTLLLNTVGGSIENIASQRGVLAYVLGAIASAFKIMGGLLALALVRPWGAMIPRRWLVASAVALSVVLVSYGGLLVVVGALVLLNIVHPSGVVDWTALRWHVLVWDMWFLLWGTLMALATVDYRKRIGQTAIGGIRFGVKRRLGE